MTDAANLRFHIVGTSAGKTVPRPFCRCRVCDHARLVGGRDVRTRCGVHLYLDGEPEGEPRYAVDLSPDAHGGQLLRGGLVLDRLEHLLVTHAHEDHLDPGLLAVRGSILSDRAAPPDLHVYGSVTVGEQLSDGLRERSRIRFHEIEPGQTFDVGALRVSALLAHHGPGVALNYIVEHAGRSVLLAWDTGWWADETWAALEGRRFDTVISECTILGPGEANREGRHLNFATLLQMKARLTEMGCIEPSTPWATLHIGDNGGLTYDEQVAFAQPHGVTVGWDGLRLAV